jgi:hypothetical protein
VTNKKKTDEIQSRSLLSAAEAKLKRVVDLYSGPMRGMREKIRKLKHTIPGLSLEMFCDDADDSGDDANFSSDSEIRKY